MLHAGGSLGSARPHARECASADAGDGPDPGILSVAIELADHALRGLSLPRSAYAGLLSDLYEGVRMRMPYRELMDFARATALCAQDGAGMPAVDRALPASANADAAIERRAAG
jgi:hypothetical protein